MMVRLPGGMRDEIKKRARKAGRSMNAEIVQILSAAINHEIQGDDHMARGDAELRIRIPHDLRDGVKSKASEANRTMNGEIVLALQAHLGGQSARQQEYTRYTIRVPQALYEQVSAASGEKSVNAEICEALDAHYNNAPAADMRDRFAEAALVGLADLCAQDTLVARKAYLIADAMMAERERKP
jgi:predicted HicB family RNase H-like nuclease